VYASYDIFQANPDGSGLVRLTSTPGYDAEATIGNDGRVVFTSVRDGDMEIYSMKGDGTDVTRLTNRPGPDGGPFFSPDGSQIVFRGRPLAAGKELDDYRLLLKDGLWRPTSLEIFVMNRDGSHRRTLAADAGSQDGYPEWSPSGKRIGFTSNRSGSSEVWAMRADGTHLVQLTTGFGSHYSPAWSPDGTAMIVSDGTTIYRLNLATRGLKPLQPESGYGTSWQPLV
jgi:Tol biopolymer transport system component